MTQVSRGTSVEHTSSAQYEIQSPQLDKLEHGQEVPKDVWEPIFAKPELLGALDELLEEGEFVLARGSVVQNAIYGGYKLDPQTGNAIPGQLTDFDFSCPANVSEKVGQIDGISSRRMARSLFLETPEEVLHLEFVDITTLADRYKTAAHKIRQYVRAHEQGYFPRLWADELVDSHFDEWEDPQTFLKYSGFAYQNCSGFMFKKEDGELKVIFIDPRNSIEQAQIHTATRATDNNESAFFGTSFDMFNPDSVQLHMLLLLPYLEDFKDEEGWVSYELGTTCARLTRDACERDMYFIGHLPRDLDGILDLPYYDYLMRNFDENIYVPYNQYLMLYKLAEDVDGRLDEMPFFEKSARSIKKANQEAFARSAFQKPVVAAEFAFSYYPFSSVIIPHLSRKFAPQFTTIMPDMARFSWVDSREGFNNIFRDSCINSNEGGETLYEMSMFYNRLTHLFSRVYGARDDQMYESSDIYENYGKPPTSMSELIALYLTSAGVDIDATANLEDIVDEVVTTWKPKGGTKMPWAKTELVEFDLAVTKEDTLRYVKTFRQVLGEIEVEQKAESESVSSIV